MAYYTQAHKYNALITKQEPPDSAFRRAWYKGLLAYYNNNGLYEVLNEIDTGPQINKEDIKGIRNPAKRVVEFYASKLWPGDMRRALQPDIEVEEGKEDKLLNAIKAVFQRSNMQAQKQRMAREFAIYGDICLKVATRFDEGNNPTAVYIQSIDPRNVTKERRDERGFLTYIRFDVPYEKEDENGDTETWYHTEVWDKETQEYRLWDHQEGLDAKLNELGPPTETKRFEDTHKDDYIPVVYQPFREDGQGFGAGAFSGELDKIDEVNRKATRLAAVMYAYDFPDFKLTTDGKDAMNRPLPPVKIGSNDDGTDDDVIEADGSKVWRLPGGADISPVTPDINFESRIKAIQEDMMELEKDLPELAYARLREMGEVSGKAVKLLLDDAFSKLEEARGNGESAIIRVTQMAISVGDALGIDELKGVGDYKAGALDFTFKPQEFLPEDKLEMLKQRVDIADTLIFNTDNVEESLIAVGFDRETAANLARGDLIPAQDR